MLAIVHVPFGDYMARVYTSPEHLRVERGMYRLVGVDPDREQTWGVYARSVLAFSAVSVLFLYLFQRVQSHLPLSLGFSDVPSALAFNTAASFVTNTNWQAYSGESTMGHLVQMAGLAVQNFASAAVGMAVAIALVRGFARRRTDRLGNFWVDLTRTCVRILLPIAVVGAVVFVAAGMVQNFRAGTSADHAGRRRAGDHRRPGGLPGGHQGARHQRRRLLQRQLGPPVREPDQLDQLRWRSSLLLVIPLLAAAHVRQAGRRQAAGAGDRRGDGGDPGRQPRGQRRRPRAPRTAPCRPRSAPPPRAPTSASACRSRRSSPPRRPAPRPARSNSFHDSYTAIGGATLLFNMMLGEIAPGGTGSGLYGILILAIITVFVAGLMIGRTPEYLGKKIGSREIRLASLYILTTPLVVLVGTGIAMALPGQRAGMLNSGAHGLSEVLYAFTSAGNNNGSAFAGITVNTVWYNTALGLAMLVGRFLPIVLVLGLAGSLARQRPVPVSAGTLPTYRPQFVGLLTGVILIVVALTYFPALALGPLAEGIH